MRTTPEGSNAKKDPLAKETATSAEDMLHRLAFNNSLQATIISVVRSGKIIVVNRAACKLLGYSKKMLQSKNRASIFDIHEASFKKMLRETTDGHATGLVTAIKKNGKQFPCQITSAVFKDVDDVDKAIITITDLSEIMRNQKISNLEKERKAADDISRPMQESIDVKNEKAAANDGITKDGSDPRLMANSEWKKYIGKTSYDVMWDWDIATGKIYAGDSIEEIFGYKLKKNILTFKNFTLRLLPKERDAVKQKLFKAIDSGSKTWSDAYRLKRKDGSVSLTECRASIVRDGRGKAVRLIGAIKDTSRIHELEKKQLEEAALKKECDDIFQLAAKLSFDGIWDWNLETNEYFLGEGFERIFGFSTKSGKKSKTGWSSHIHPDDRAGVVKDLARAIASSASQWEQAYRFIRANGSIANVFGRAAIIRNDHGKAIRMIGAIHDLSRQKDLEDKLAQALLAKGKMTKAYKENFKLIFNSSSDILYDADVLSNEVMLSDAYEKEFGYTLKNNITTIEEWFSHIHADDKKALIKEYARMLSSKETAWEYKFRFLRADNSVAHIITKGIVLRNENGEACRRIGYMQDLSKQKVLEESLQQEIRLKEKQIAEASTEAKETERSDIGKELHDNVNQLLGASNLYLDMAKNGGPHSQMYLSRSSEYTLMAIEEIRKLTKGLTTDTIRNLGLCEAIEGIVRDTMEVSSLKISYVLKTFKEDSVNDKFKLNLFRIVQEQLNNILKHAKATEVTIRLLQGKKSLTLYIRDNGVGFDMKNKITGIGIANIKSRASAYKGTVSLTSQPEQGCMLTARFTIADILANTG